MDDERNYRVATGDRYGDVVVRIRRTVAYEIVDVESPMGPLRGRMLEHAIGVATDLAERDDWED